MSLYLHRLYYAHTGMQLLPETFDVLFLTQVPLYHFEYIPYGFA